MLLQIAKFHSFLWLRSNFIVYIHYILIHPSIHGHWGCFHVLAIVNNASLNTGVHVSFWICVLVFLGGIYPRAELLGHVLVLFLAFWETSILFTIVAAPIYIATSGVWRFSFLYILAKICYFCSFWWQPFWQVWGDSTLWFWFAFPWRLARLSIFSCLLPLYVMVLYLVYLFLSHFTLTTQKLTPGTFSLLPENLLKYIIESIKYSSYFSCYWRWQRWPKFLLQVSPFFSSWQDFPYYPLSPVKGPLGPH